MAENKKSFILYADYLSTIEELTDDEAGKLLKHLFNYVNDKNPEPPENRIVKLAFEPIKQQLKRDLKDWEEKKIKRSEAGKIGGVKSGEVRKQNEANEANASFASKNEANEAVNGNVTVNGTVTVNDIINNSTPFSPDKSLIDVELDENDVDLTIVYIEALSKKSLSTAEISSFWKAFKIQYFKGEKKYKDWPDLLQHFRDWLKVEASRPKYNNNGSTHKRTIKEGSSAFLP